MLYCKLSYRVLMTTVANFQVIDQDKKYRRGLTSD